MAAPIFGQGEILHSPAQTAIPGQDLDLELMVTGTGWTVDEVRMLYNRANHQGFVETQMANNLGYYTGTIPAEFISEEGVKYLFVAELSNGTRLSYPEQDAHAHPVYVQATEVGTDQQQDSPGEAQESRTRERPPDAQLILAPEPNVTIPRDEALIAISLFQVADVDTASVVLLVDGVNVTRRAQVTANLVTYRPETILPGTHTVRMQFNDAAGRRYSPINWRFQVMGEEIAEGPRFELNGEMYVENAYANIKEQVENANKLGVALKGEYGAYEVTGNAYLTSKENPNVQPRNRYTLQIQSPRVQAEVGDFYPRLTRLGMWGKRIRGFNTRLHLSPFHVQVIYGRSQRAIPGVLEDLTATEINQGYTQGINGYSFGRRVIGVRPSVGNGQNFELGFSFISARDDTTTVLNKIADLEDETLLWKGITPKDNIVVGSDLLLAFDNRRIMWESSAALSWKNNNIFGGALSEGDTIQLGTDFSLPVADFPILPSAYQRIFVINNNVQPFLPVPMDVTRDPADTSKYLVHFNPWQFNDYSSLAYQTDVTFQYFSNSVMFRYRRVGPAYYSFTNPYLNRDVAGFEISDRIRLWRNKLYLTLKYENYTEGISKEEDSRLSASNLSAGISLYPGQGLPTVNVRTSGYHRSNALDSVRVLPGGSQDLVVDNRIDNRTTSNVVTISQPLSLFGAEHDARIHIMRSRKMDGIQRPSTYPDVGYSMNVTSFEFQSRFHFPLTTRVAVSVNRNQTLGNDVDLQTLSVGGVYKLFQNNLIVNGNLRLARNLGGDKFNSTGLESSIQYRFLTNHGLTASFQAMRLSEPPDEYTNLLYRLRYSYAFK